jgi:predicted NUDIX family NTP pyrophosphohydrolase
MPQQQSAGLLVYRRRGSAFEFLLVHPGGPFWRGKDEGAWSIPKGLLNEGEDAAAAAAREFEEEVGQAVTGDMVALRPVRQKSGKVVHVWLLEADLDLSSFRSNEVEMEWPRRSGRIVRFPEADEAAYFETSEALRKVLAGQAPILQEALARLQETVRL